MTWNIAVLEAERSCKLFHEADVSPLFSGPPGRAGHFTAEAGSNHYVVGPCQAVGLVHVLLHLIFPTG